MEPVILDSARQHGVTDEDMLHAYRNTIRVFEDDAEGLTMFIGPGQDTNLLEIGVVVARDFDGVVIAHAMEARRKYLNRMR